MQVPPQLKPYCFKKGQRPWNYSRVELTCPECNSKFFVPPCHLNRRKYCSHKCLAKAQSRERKGVFGIGETNPRFKNGISLYRRWIYAQKPKICEYCGSTKHIEIHHIDFDRTNNKLDNLKVLCRSCHVKIDNRTKNLSSHCN